jgi:hypothetical protein
MPNPNIDIENVIKDLNSEVTNIKDKLKEGVDEVVFSQLTKNAKLLQDKIDKLLKKAGAISKDDVEDAYASLRKTKRDELEAMSRKANTRLIVSIVLIGLIVGGIYYFKKKKNVN